MLPLKDIFNCHGNAKNYFMQFKRYRNIQKNLEILYPKVDESDIDPDDKYYFKLIFFYYY